ncbi:MAG: hypothetical protein FWF92_08490 [Oscillospiraceae bacterium]|nr:hypothetical protein [Oscillospiraceae bacterium]
MKYEITPAPDDLEYFLSQNRDETERIVSGMTSIIDANEETLSALQNQQWFQRMWYTASGKNKATVKEMEQNRDKLATYSVQVLHRLMEETRISDAIISNLTIRLNEIYSSHLKLQEMMCDIMNKLNEKIESVDNYHNLITDIQNRKYDSRKIFANLLKILSRFDKRTFSNEEYLIRIKETMEKNRFNFSKTISIYDCAEQILTLSEESVGQVYLFAQNHTEIIFIQFACRLIEQYHFEPKSNRRIVRNNAIKIALENCGLTGNKLCVINELYDDIKISAISKFEMLKKNYDPKIVSKKVPKQITEKENKKSFPEIIYKAVQSLNKLNKNN